jgi:hypothetical protein
VGLLRLWALLARNGGEVEEMVGRNRVDALEAERSALSGNCEQCGTAFVGRRDKRFCRDACRTRFGRERKTRQLQETIARLVELAGGQVRP